MGLQLGGQDIEIVSDDFKILDVINSKADNFCKEMNEKFGVAGRDTKALLEVAKQKQLNVIGVSFHIGMTANDTEIFYHMVKAARRVFDEAATIGHNFSLLDIGGGFAGEPKYDQFFIQVAENVQKALTAYFPPSTGVRIIAEPGRFIVTSAFTAVCEILTIKEGTQAEDQQSDNGENKQIYQYYLSDGIFGTFSFPFRKFQLKTTKDAKGEKLYTSVLWGPSCAGIDIIGDSFLLPKLDNDDLVYFENMGNYSLSGISRFTGFGDTKTYYVVTKTRHQDIRDHLKKYMNGK